MFDSNVNERLEFSDKQLEFWRNANHRWNIKTGATRSGKTFMDYFVIAKRIRACTGSGLIVILGNTKSTIERNLLSNMRNIFGSALVGNISSDNTLTLFGKKVYALGADKANQVSKIQGSGIEYCYGDEVTTWNEDVFTMLKSRLDKDNSCFDGTCNPDNPNHWFKVFLDSDADIYHQAYNIYDNPFNSKSFVNNLEKEYAGTIYYDRYILGLWKQAEGTIYKKFANNPEYYFVHSKDLPKFMQINIGLDFGANKSGHAFVATGITYGYDKLIALKSKKYMNKDYKDGITPEMIDKFSIEFVDEVIKKYGRCDYFYWDNEATVLGNGIKKALKHTHPQVNVRRCIKSTIRERIDLKIRLIGQDRYFYTEDCETLKQATIQAVYDKTKQEDTRLDDFTSDIDTLDAEEYSFTRNIMRFIQ